MYSKRKYVEGYRSWLSIQNYVSYTVDYDPRKLSEFLAWVELQGVVDIEDITGQLVKGFFKYLSLRKSKNTGTVLSLTTLRGYLTTLNRFARYLRQSEQGNLTIPVQFKGRSNYKAVVFSKAEIERIYRVTDDSLLGVRDRAMLAVYYGCGARRNEGVQLEIRDILPDKNLLYIRKGKGYKERYIPMIGKVKKDILDYVVSARPMLLGNQVSQSLFIGIRGKAIGAEALYGRFKKLLKKARIEKSTGLHALRHSIATHLLVGGMKLSQIAKFLGHSSLESTQIYTHLRHEV